MEPPVYRVSSQTVISNLALRKGWADIFDILWHLFLRQLKPPLILELTFLKKEWVNYEKLQEIAKKFIFFAA